jgi:hypothetical protein
MSKFLQGSLAILLLAGAAQAAEAPVVKLGKSLGKIDPRIYGTNFLMDPALKTKLVRFGGNGVSRYNSLNGKYNNSFDWDFSNTGMLSKEEDPPVGKLRAMGAEPLVQAPMLGYLAGDRTWGAVKVDPSRACAAMVRELNIVKKAGIKYWALDNEPDCWQGTHKDVFQHKLRYDEYMERYLKTAKAMKAVDPSILLYGPVSANKYFYDKLNDPEDQKEKGPWLPYFLKRAKEHDKKWGKRSVDYLDIHRYPDSGKDDKAMLDVSREWWDTTYGKDEPILLEMKRWISENYPGTKLSISEYSCSYKRKLCQLVWLTQNLGLFGKYGVSSANKWGVEAEEKLVYGLYGNLFGDEAIDIKLPAGSPLEIYASRNSANGDVILVLINKDLEAAQNAVLSPDFKPIAQDAYTIQEDAAKKPVLSHSPKSKFTVTYSCPPLSITFLRLWKRDVAVRGDFTGPSPEPSREKEEAAKLEGGGYPFAEGSGYYLYHSSVITHDQHGFDSYQGGGDTGLVRGGARDQVATDLKENHEGTAPKDALVWFDNSNRTGSFMPKDRKDALVFDWKHANGGWVDLRLAHDLKWDPQDLAPFVKGNGSLVFYVKAIEPGSDMTVYIENNLKPERTLSLQASDFTQGGAFVVGGWQEVRIPLSQFELPEQGIDLARVRYVGFGNAVKAGACKAMVDDIMFVMGN